MKKQPAQNESLIVQLHAIYFRDSIVLQPRNYLSIIIIYDVFNGKSSIRLSFSCNDTWDNRKTVLEEVVRIMLGCCRIMLPAHLHKINWTLLLCSRNNTKLWVPQKALSYEYDVTMNKRNERRKADMLKNFSIISCSDYSSKKRFAHRLGR